MIDLGCLAEPDKAQRAMDDGLAQQPRRAGGGHGKRGARVAPRGIDAVVEQVHAPLAHLAPCLDHQRLRVETLLDTHERGGELLARLGGFALGALEIIAAAHGFCSIRVA